MDTFDPKPRLDREHGQPIKAKVQPTQFNNVGTVLKSPWKFRQYGQSGIPVSSLFPNVATCVDDMAIVRSMTANFSEHTTANYFMHTGSGLQGRPSAGSWVTYGLGSESANLPGFVVLSQASSRRVGRTTSATDSCPRPIRAPSSKPVPSRSRTHHLRRTRRRSST